MKKKFTGQAVQNESVDERFIQVVKKMYQNKFDLEGQINKWT